jgi:hypothetical protein
VSYKAMMQQQREKEQIQETPIVKERLEFRYQSTSSRIIGWTIFLVTYLFVIYIFNVPENRHRKFIKGTFYLIIGGISNYFYDFSPKYKTMKDHKNKIFTVDSEGITCQDLDKTTYIRWEEVAHAHFHNNTYTLVKSGTEEESISWNNTYMYLSKRDEKPQSLLKYLYLESFRNSIFYKIAEKHQDESLAEVVTEYCPFIQTQSWEVKDEDTIGIKSPRASYQVAGAQVFSYHTKYNRSLTLGKIMTYVLSAIGIGIVLGILNFKFISGYFAIFVPILILIPAFRYIYFWYSWFRGAQIETDDLGISLVWRKGVYWQTQWFIIDSYTQNDFEGTFTTKDGKTYKFPLNTSRSYELEAEIKRRIGEG